MKWFIAVCIVVAVVLIARWLKKPARPKGVPRGRLEKCLGDVLQYHGDGSIVIIEEEKSKRFVQFSKYFLPSGRPSLHFGFPDAEWSRDYFGTVEARVRDMNVAYTVRRTGHELCPRFLDVNDIVDGPDAFSLAVSVFAAMGVPESSTFCVKFEWSIDPTAAVEFIKANSRRAH